MIARCNIFLTMILMSFLLSCSQVSNLVLKSPDESFVFTLNTGEEDSVLTYNVDFQGKSIIEQANLGFKFGGAPGPPQYMIAESVNRSVDTTWKPLYGERNEYPDHYNETLVRFKGSGHLSALRIRAYDEGVAFRYEFEGEDEVVSIVDELTEFHLPPDAGAWVSSKAQSEITMTTVAEIHEARERPMLIQYDDSLFVAIGEAALIDYARMKLINKAPGSGILRSHLAGDVEKTKPFKTPWRFIMAGDRPSKLLENNFLVLNLNESNQIENPSWIKPGKVLREVTLTTQGGMACVDFAHEHNLQFVEFDAGWYGNEYDDSSDATTITVDPGRSPGPLDLHSVIEYAMGKDIGVILYVNRRALEKQLDEVLPLLESWGVAGVKYGFVNVGPQEWTDWLHDAVRKASTHHLMVDIHDEYRPTGYSRTYPNLMTQEGIRGDEESPPNDMVINTIFTRMIAGAGDHTNCYFASRVKEEMGSHTAQMAKAICIYSPWQFLYWYDRPAGSPGKKGGAGNAETGIPEIPDLTFYDQIPTVWDDTRVLDGYPGKLASIARKNGENWYLGVLTGTQEHNLALTLDFLEPGRTYEATLFTHDESLNTATMVSILKEEVNSETVLVRKIPEQNGLAVIFKPT